MSSLMRGRVWRVKAIGNLVEAAAQAEPGLCEDEAFAVLNEVLRDYSERIAYSGVSDLTNPHVVQYERADATITLTPAVA